MAWRIVVQPNGKFARFSEVVDDFTHYDMDRDEAVKVCCETIGSKYVDEKIQRGINEPGRFEKAIEIIQMVHGKKRADKVRILLSC